MLVIDTPKTCEDCCYMRPNRDWGYRCVGIQYRDKDWPKEVSLRMKPDWCPLKEVSDE